MGSVSVVHSGVSVRAFRAVQTISTRLLNECNESELRPVLPCLVRMGLISTMEPSQSSSSLKVDILTVVSPMELVNSIVALLSIDFHALDTDLRKEQQLRLKGHTQRTDSILLGPHSNMSMALEYERSDMTRRLSMLLGELLYVQAQIQEAGPDIPFVHASELFDNDIFTDELADILCIALAELTTLHMLPVINTLLHLHNGPHIIEILVANFPDSFRDVCTFLIQTGDKQDDSESSILRARVLNALCRMDPSEALSVRNRCVELCRMPALAIQLTLRYASFGMEVRDPADNATVSHRRSDVIAFVSGLLLGSDQTARIWMSLYLRTGQKRKSEALQELRRYLLDTLDAIISECVGTPMEVCDSKSIQTFHLIPDSVIVEACAVLRLYCALRGIASIKFNEDECQLLVRLLTMHPCRPSMAGIRFVSIGLCMLIACPSLTNQSAEQERRCIEWVQWLVREEAYLETGGGSTVASSSFGEQLLLMAIHFHANQLSAICDLVCATLGMKIPIRHNNMARMKVVFTQEIFTEQVVAAHAARVPVTPRLNANMTGFLPIHCIHQLLKSRAFSKHNVNIKLWIYDQICASTAPLHPVLPPLVEVYVNTLTGVAGTTGVIAETNRPLSESEIRAVFERSSLGCYMRRASGTINDASACNSFDGLTAPLLMLYYLLLYEDACTFNRRLAHIYSVQFLSELPIKYLLSHAQKDQWQYSGLCGPLLKLLAMHFPHLMEPEDWLDDMGMSVDGHGASLMHEQQDESGFSSTRSNRNVILQESELRNAFRFATSRPSQLAHVLRQCLECQLTDLWPYAELIVSNILRMLDSQMPRHVQDLFRDVWLRLNTVLPRRLWVITVRYATPSSQLDLTPASYSSSNGNTSDVVMFEANASGSMSPYYASASSPSLCFDVADDPLQIMRCDPRIYRCASIYTIVLRVLRASLASSRCQLMQHLQTAQQTVASVNNPGSATLIEKEELCRATIAAQESLAVQMLLETCMETEQDRRIEGQMWALQEVRSLVCSYLHQGFIADTILAKLVHFQGYSSELLPVTVKGIPSMHICLDFLQDLMTQPQESKQIFGIQLLSHLCNQFALAKSITLCVLALNILFALIGGISCEQRLRVFPPILPALVRMGEAFPPLHSDIITLLMQIARVCDAHICMPVVNHTDFMQLLSVKHLKMKSMNPVAQSRRLAVLTRRTFAELLDRAILNGRIYHQN